MKPAYAIYVLQVEWSWDHANTELATVTVEGREGCRYQPEFELLLNPEVSARRKQDMLGHLKQVAGALGRARQGDCKLVRLYRVDDADGFWSGVQSDESFASGEVTTVQLRLRPICTFDDLGNPVDARAEKQSGSAA